MTEQTSDDLDGPRLAPRNGGAPQRLVIFLHGVGSDGEDLIQLAPMLQDLLPDAAFVSPHAPFPFDMAPMGRQWFSFRDDSPAAINSAVAENYVHFDRFLDTEMARTGISADRVAIVGFSQGGMIALHTALRRPEPPAALLALSTVLAAPTRLPEEIRCRPPVLLVHGDQDPVLPVDYCRESARVLEANEVPAETHVLKGRGHEIDQEGLQLIRDFLARHLAGA